MPSTTQVLAFAVLAAGLIAAAYLAALSHELLLGLGIAAAAILVAALFVSEEVNRETVAVVTIAVTIVYGVFTLQLPAAVVAACLVYLTLWVTGDDGPFDATPPSLFPEYASDNAHGSDGDSNAEDEN